GIARAGVHRGIVRVDRLENHVDRSALVDDAHAGIGQHLDRLDEKLLLEVRDGDHLTLGGGGGEDAFRFVKRDAGQAELERVVLRGASVGYSLIVENDARDEHLVAPAPEKRALLERAVSVRAAGIRAGDRDGRAFVLLQRTLLCRSQSGGEKDEEKRQRQQSR